jgi:hypothetical protein
MQPVAIEVAVRVKTVDKFKLVVCVVILVGERTRSDGVQRYVNGPSPVTEPVRVVLVPNKMLASAPALTDGSAVTTTVIVVDVAHWPASGVKL